MFLYFLSIVCILISVLFLSIKSEYEKGAWIKDTSNLIESYNTVKRRKMSATFNFYSEKKERVS
jgi:hypothetical protein